MRARLALPLAVLLLPGLAACGSAEPRDASPEDARIELTAAQEDQVDRAIAAYADWVRAETAALLSGTRRFVTAVKAGDDDLARSLYAPTRMHWERIEPVAESFGDLDPRTDAREADVPGALQQPGQALGVVDVHLAPVGAHLVRPRHGLQSRRTRLRSAAERGLSPTT